MVLTLVSAYVSANLLWFLGRLFLCKNAIGERKIHDFREDFKDVVSDIGSKPMAIFLVTVVAAFATFPFEVRSIIKK